MNEASGGAAEPSEAGRSGPYPGTKVLLDTPRRGVRTRTGWRVIDLNQVWKPAAG